MEEEGLHKPEECIQQIGELVRGSWLCVGNDPAEAITPAACYKAASQTECQAEGLSVCG